MIQKTNTIASQQIVHESVSEIASSQISYDLKNAILIVSLVINLTVLTVWIAVQVTSQYDAQLVGFLLNR
jgi:hypothetical protein